MSNSEPNFFFELENARSLGAKEQLLSWAERVFSEPKLVGQSFDVRLFDITKITPEQEAQLYNNFQGRDSELGMGLVNWRRAELSEVVTLVRTAVAKRYMTISMTKTRIDAIDKINQAEPNPKLRYPASTIEQLKQEGEQASKELSYLRSRIAQLYALESLLKAIQSEGGQANSRNTEQLLRSLGQNWRGLLRVRAWAEQFRNSAVHKTNHLQLYSFNRDTQGYLLKLSAASPPIVIAKDTARYMYHILEVIDNLALTVIPILVQPNKLREMAQWFPVATLLRAIIEFFHFCNFEIPVFYLNVAVDIDDPAQVYQKEAGHWKTVNDGEVNISSTFKRMAQEAALLLAESNPLLECTDLNRLDRFLKYIATYTSNIEPVEGRDIQPFISSGLSDFDLDPAGQKVKFRTAFPLMSSLIYQLVGNKQEFQHIRSSTLGGPFETIIGMALLDPRAFNLSANTINTLDRFHYLANFWRAVGRRRAIAMFGEEYVQKVSQGLQALGQPGPENPTFLTIKVPSFSIGREQMLSATAEPSTVGQDALPGLIMADQMKIIDLINITWALADDFLLSLREMKSNDDLPLAIGGFPRMVDSYREELVKRFNEKWLSSMNWVWSMIRGLSPMLWDFWSKVGAERAWDDMISRAPTMAALGLLLRMFCDTARLILLLEMSGSAVATGLRINSESASQAIMLGLERFLFNSSTSSILAESVDYYFDPEIQFDSWLAFISSYKMFLQRSIKDLQQMNAAVEHWQLLQNIHDDLEELYPSVVVASTPPTKTPTKELPEMFLAETSDPEDSLRLIQEKDASEFHKVCFELLGTTNHDSILFLRTLAIYQDKEMHKWISQGAYYKAIIEHLLPDIGYRRLLYSLPSRADSFFRLLEKMEEDNRLSHMSLDLIQPQVIDYFEQLNEAYSVTMSRFAACPRVLPQESAESLSNRFIKKNSSQPSQHPFLLLLVCDYPIIYLNTWDSEQEYDLSRVMVRIRSELELILGKDQMEDPLIEIFILAGGQIAIRPGRIYVYGSSRSCEPAFIEPEKALSRLILSKFVSNKFALALDILRTQFPEQTFVVQP
ncbi:MAG: hypothetical protein HY819_03310 [Acidobacteria bacterium]|nr:hypothetical protein [Acidobacteriota bacterium]